jgi:antitoxin VapB
MARSTLFANNGMQAVRIPAALRLPDDVRLLEVRARARERIITPLHETWDSFFRVGPPVSDDFMPERAAREQSGRERR